jgi:hypothetical protein
MEAIKMLEVYWEQLKRIFVYAQYCAGSEMHAPVCRDFWIWVMIASFTLAALVLFYVCKRIIKEQLEFRRNEKRLAARANVASEEEMEKVAWRGDSLKGDLSTLPTEELAKKFRTALTKEETTTTAG